MKLRRESIRQVILATIMVAMSSVLTVGSAQAAKPRVPGSGGKGLIKPRQYTTLWTVGVYDETVFKAKNLRWSGWGRRVATGRGTLTHCVAEYERCHSFGGVVQFRKKRKFKRCGGPAYPFYTEIRLTTGHGRNTGWIRFLDCARVPKRR